MAFEDLFGNNMTTSAGDMTPDPSDFTGGDPHVDDGGGFLSDLFSDQNVIRGMGEMGASISAGDPAGKVLGNFASNITRRKAFQKNASQVRDNRAGQSKSVNDELMKFLFEKKLLGKLEDNNSNDWIKINADGGITSGMKNVAQPASFASSPSLESVRRPAPGGNDLPDFSSQPSGGVLDFAGLDPKDVALLMRAERRYGYLDQNQMQMLLKEKARRSGVAERSRTRAEDLKRLGEEGLARSMQAKRDAVAKVAAAEKLTKDRLLINQEKAKLDSIGKRLNPAESARAEREIKLKENELQYKEDKLQAEKDNLGRTVGLKSNEILALDKYSATQREKIADEDTDFEVALELADSENNRPGAGVVYVHDADPGTDKGWFWFDKPVDDILSYSIPKDLMFYNQPATGAEIIRRAKLEGMTVPEYLKEAQQRR